MNLPPKFVGLKASTLVLDGATSPVLGPMVETTGDAWAAPGTGANAGQIAQRVNAHPATSTVRCPAPVASSARAVVVDLESVRFEGLRPTVRLTVASGTEAVGIVWDQSSARLVAGSQSVVLMNGNMTAVTSARMRLVVDRTAGTVEADFAGSTGSLPVAPTGELSVTLSNETAASPAYANHTLWWRRLAVTTVWPASGQDTTAIIGTPGSVAPSRQWAQVRLSTAQTVPNSTRTRVTEWRTPTGFGVPAGTEAGTWRPRAGRWLIHATVGFQSNTGRRFMSLHTRKGTAPEAIIGWAELPETVGPARVTGAVTALGTFDGQTDVWLSVEQRSGEPVPLDTGALVTRFDIQYLGP